jgi:hypothetical protein
MRRTKSLGVIVVMTLVLAVIPAHAQTAEDWRKAVLLRIGPLYLGPTLVIDNLGVDNNVFNDGKDARPDYTATVTPGATIWLPIARRALITTRAGLGLVYFRTYKNQRDIRPNVNVSGDLSLRRLTLQASGGTSRSNERPNSEIDARASRVENSASLGLSLALTNRLSVTLSGQGRLVQVDPGAVFRGVKLRDTLNRIEQGLTLTVRRQLTSLTTVYVAGQTQKDRFEFSPRRNSYSVRVAPGVEFKPKAFISGTAEVGVRRFDVLDRRVPDFTVLVANVALSYKFRDTTEVGVTWDSDVEDSISPEAVYYLRNLVGVRIRRQLAGRYDAILGATHDGNSYRKLDSSPKPKGQYTGVIVYTADLGYRVNRLTRVGFAVSTSARSSTAASSGYQGVRAGLSLNYGF